MPPALLEPVLHHIQMKPSLLTSVIALLASTFLLQADPPPAVEGASRSPISTFFVQPDALLICFQDSPPSIPAHDLPHIFDRLYRVESSRNRALGGSGLGLAICRSIVTAHRGTIEAGPSPLGGLSITITLPFG